MASEIKVNNIKDTCGTAVITKCGATHTVTAEVYKANTIQDTSGNAYLAKCGTTVTLGGCGQTIALAAGASQTGFGRTGTVDWDTTAKTTSFTAVSGNGYFVNTSGGAITITLPAGSAGDIVSFMDYSGTWQTNNVTITPNGSDNIGGSNNTATLNVEGQSVTFVYSDSTKGWLNTMDSTSNVRAKSYVTATGGTITTCGDYKIHAFTGPGTFCVSCAGGAAGSNTVQLLLVAGGGSGGGRYGGGGGGGGLILSPSCGTPVSVTGYPIAIGAGGIGPCNTCGNNTTGFSLTAVGGGRGQHAGPGQPGGSGGGGGQAGPPGRGCGTQTSQAGNSGAWGFGNPSGCGQSSAPQYGHSGGGGAGGAGTPGTPSAGGPGGNGKDVAPIFGAAPKPYYASRSPGPCSTYAGGGGGGVYAGGPAGSGGSGGGGPSVGSGPGTPGDANTGSGGGGHNLVGGCGPGGNGGSGVVLIRYKFQN